MWREFVAALRRTRARIIERRALSRAGLPIGLIVAVAIVCIVVAVLASARRADEAAVRQERALIGVALAERSGSAPIDQGFLNRLSARLDLPGLRLLGSEGPSPDESVYEVADQGERTVARLAWTPQRPSGDIVRDVLPFLVVAFLWFALLAVYGLRHLRQATGEDRLRHLALHDPLSGLPNRTRFNQGLAATIEEMRRTGRLAAMLSIDLDRFKEVNDTLGHLVGDAVIRAVALRLAGILRGSDLVARLGGDEFAVLAADLPDTSAALSLGERIVQTLRAPYSIMGHTIVIGASIGIATIEPSAREADDIMRRADVALYRAKNDGRNSACIYDADMDADLRERKQLERDLRDAVACGGLALAFQPIVAASGRETIGIEALCRWRHPVRGDVPPSVFIPIAEQSELIIGIGEWVLRQACRAAVAWPDLVLAVNVSPLQFRHPRFVATVEQILQATGFPPDRLEFDVTESTLLGNWENAEAAMRRLKSLGVRFALDDFGTGYSSLLYVRSFPFDQLKIDRSFVRNIETATEAAAMVHAVVSLGRGFGMKVTAEGVETAGQHLFLRAAGIHAIQGYRFGRPAEIHEIVARLAHERAGRAAEAPRVQALAS